MSTDTTPGDTTPGDTTPGPRARAARTATDDAEGINLVVLRGRVSSPPEVRVLPSGSRLLTLALRVPTSDPASTSVPVAVWEPASWLDAVGPDDELLVTGTVRRRFFRAGGATGARVEVQAVAIARAGDRRRRAALTRRALGELARLD